MTPQCDVQGVIELGRGRAVDPAVERHVEGCPGCAQRLASERALSNSLRAFANTTAHAGPREGLEADLLAALAASRRTVQPARTPRTWWATAAALALAVSSAVYSVGRLEPIQPAVNPPADFVTAFVPWPGAEVLPPFESGQLVRVELPASVLPLLGIGLPSPREDVVVADVLIGQDGLARAVRLAP